MEKLENMRKELEAFMESRDWKAEAKEAVLAFYDRWMGQKACRGLFEKWMDLYREDVHIDYKKANQEAEEMAAQAGMNVYEALLLLYLCFGRILPEHYRKAGLPMDICENSLDDLKWKAVECHKVYGVWGSFVAHWFSGFFDLTRFALGRMQYELVPLPEECRAEAARGEEPSGEEPSGEELGGEGPSGISGRSFDGVKWAINTHIPSCGKLDHEECVSSYKKAAAFWKQYFQIEQPVFVCDSWLLYPEHEKFLPEGSNILKFQRDYEVFEVRKDEKGGDLWRIFDREYDGKPENLPEDTSLRRAYKKWLMEGNAAGSARGILRETVI